MGALLKAHVVHAPIPIGRPTNADLLGLPLITPLHVFAARRESFDVIVRRTWSAPRALSAIFEALPLDEHGWDINSTRMTHIGNSDGLYPIWRVSR